MSVDCSQLNSAPWLLLLLDDVITHRAFLYMILLATGRIFKSITINDKAAALFLYKNIIYKGANKLYNLK